MRKLIASTYATLDGFIDNPHEWSLQYSEEESQTYAFTMTKNADALLLGRVTYEGMAQAWPNMGGNPYADHVNSMDKYVVASQPVDTSSWKPTTVIDGADLAAAGLLDEHKIWLYPVIKGTGEPLFRPESAGTVELVDSTIFPSGVAVLTYRPLTG